MKQGKIISSQIKYLEIYVKPAVQTHYSTAVQPLQLHTTAVYNILQGPQTNQLSALGSANNDFYRKNTQKYREILDPGKECDRIKAFLIALEQSCSSPRNYLLLC